MTIFAQWPNWAARLVLAALAALIAAALFQGGGSPQASGREAAHFSDVKLYRAITLRVGRGENYYLAAAAEQRAHGYPTTPAPVIRQPTEALVLTALRADPVRHLVQIGLMAAALTALWRALGQIGFSPRLQLWSIALTTTGMVTTLTPDGIFMHEVWAGLLIVLSLALRRPDRWAPSIALALLACLFREMALPFLLVMAAFALYERRWREALSWIGAMLLFCGVFALHCHWATAVYRHGDLGTAGWVRFGGLGFIVAATRWNALLTEAPAWTLIAALGVAVIGLAGRRSPLTARAALTLAGYAAAFAVIGRPDNDYWGILYAPLVPLGVILAPAALKDLWSSAAGRPASPFQAHDSPAAALTP